MLERIYVDFNTMNQDLERTDKDRRVRIGRGGDRPLADQGLRVLIGDEDLEVEATLELDRERSVWWARPDWSTRHDLPFVAATDNSPHAVS